MMTYYEAFTKDSFGVRKFQAQTDKDDIKFDEEVVRKKQKKLTWRLCRLQMRPRIQRRSADALLKRSNGMISRMTTMLLMYSMKLTTPFLLCK
jgi:hypothetical protein